MDRVNEIIYSAGLPGVPRMIPWVKFSPSPMVLTQHPAVPTQNTTVLAPSPMVLTQRPAIPAPSPMILAQLLTIPLNIPQSLLNVQ
ncbi:hypothetical protein Holit_01410 [Hollandina sp. SP2]